MSNKKERNKVKDPTRDQESYSNNHWLESESQIRFMQEARHILMSVLAAPSGDHLLVVVDRFSKSLEAELGKESPNLFLCRMWLRTIRAFLESTRQEKALKQPCREALVALLEQELSQQLDHKSLFIESVVREIDIANAPF